ncbi:hypothetical protein CBS101457_003332 [Exobasidium rhododendri]|nr:hypothetical protein CBS101457_003332 [Exobasidium rhododendri]
MSSAEVIDALFERTIDIVQSLPKTGPIQTSYEEKLALYSLYKQATDGDVKVKRPGMLDMLGRAKWDAWAKRKGYASQDAKQLYVESLLKTLRRFSDRPQAIALIEELESFSGDVAERVMSASLARAGSESDASSGSISPRIAHHNKTTGKGYIDSEEEEDERDLVAQLPPRPTMSSRPSSSQAFRAGTGPSLPHSRGTGGAQTPLSVEGGSAMAVRGGGPQSRMVENSDTDEDLPPRQGNLPSQTSQHLAQPRLVTTVRGPQSQYTRGGPNSSHQEGRFYAPANAQRYPLPPRSDSVAGGAYQTGGAGASLYSAIAPSRPTPSEQHYYHHHGGEGAGNVSRAYAASSIGGRSNPGGGGAASVKAVRPEIEMALQSIQASLQAVHERLNQVESQRVASASNILGSNSLLGVGYQALANAFHDIALLMGMARNGVGGQTGGAAPSSYGISTKIRDKSRVESVAGQSTNSKSRQGKGDRGSGDDPRRNRSGWSTVLRLLGAITNTSLRLALDLTSVTVVLSLLLLLFKRATGRGDPLLLLRLVRRYTGITRGGINEPKTIKSD